ncbi:kinase-like domain-containing protein [Gongronella butleri]|nr:kinase-like domain-containing protein [Gongronella butleri]
MPPCVFDAPVVVSVFETMFYYRHDLINVFNIIIQTPQTTKSLIRYPSDFVDFHQKMRMHYPRTKIRLPTFTTPKQKVLVQRVANLKRWLLHGKRGNADSIEAYLQACLRHPILSISTLLRDFLAVQRIDDKYWTSSMPPSDTLTTTTATIDPVHWSQISRMALQGDDDDALHPNDHNRPVDTPDTSSSIASRKKPALFRLTIDHFHLLKVIGKGCMGKVLLVESRLPYDAKLPEPRYYALKVITKQRVVQQNEVKHIKAECDILTRLRDQPFLIQLHYAFQSRHHLYLVLDFIPGGDMATQISLRISFSKAATRFYAAEILQGLSILHSYGIIYRDLKPENILIARDGHIVLTDFGLSKVFTAADQREFGQPMTKTFCGTAEYLAPEVLLGEPYTYSMDYWSLGILIYEMIVGSPPFWADTLMGMFKRVVEDELEFPEMIDLDPVTCDFISGLLEKDPFERLGWDSSEQIKKHGWFMDMDWDDVAQKKLVPPFLPNLVSPIDLQHFDESFTSMTPRISRVSRMPPKYMPTVPPDQAHPDAIVPVAMTMQPHTEDDEDDYDENEDDENEDDDDSQGDHGHRGSLDYPDDLFDGFEFNPYLQPASSSSVASTQQAQAHGRRPPPITTALRPLRSLRRVCAQATGAGSSKKRFSTSSSCPSLDSDAKLASPLATSIRKRHSAALSISSTSPTTPTPTMGTQ